MGVGIQVTGSPECPRAWSRASSGSFTYPFACCKANIPVPSRYPEAHQAVVLLAVGLACWAPTPQEAASLSFFILCILGTQA